LMSCFVIVLGISGVFMTRKLFQLHQMGQTRLDRWYSYYAEWIGDGAQVLKLRRLADAQNRSRFRIVTHIPHNLFWTLIHLSIVVIGILMLTMILC
jgi:hypothetical protein